MGERIPPSARGGTAPFPPEKLSHWLLLLPRTHPPSHLSLLSPPHYLPPPPGLSDRPGKLVGNGAGRQKRRKLRASKFKRRRGETPSAELRDGDSRRKPRESFSSRPGEPLLSRPSGPLHLPGQLRVSNREGKRTRAPHPRAPSHRRARGRASTLACFLTHFKVHSQNS